MEGNGVRGAWKKQTIVIETMEQYPKKIACLLWGDMVDKAMALNLGDTVTLSVDLESREFNGKWYTDVKVWNIKGAQQQAPASQEIPAGQDSAGDESSENDDLPF